MTRPWGRNGEEIECYGLDLDALYVNTGFRVAILDTLRGPDRTKVRSVCRYAEPVEFMPKKVRRDTERVIAFDCLWDVVLLAQTPADATLVQVLPT